MSNAIPEEFRRVVEIEGVKVEVDLRTAKKVDTYRVGDAVRVLVKAYTGWDTHPGVIIGFDDFQNRPTIRVAYLKRHSEKPVEFIAVHKDSGENYEIAPLHECDLIPTKETIDAWFDNAEDKHLRALREVQEQRAFFESQFGQAFPRYAKESAE